MMRPGWKFVLLAAVAVATLVAATSQAEACWGCRSAYAYPVYYAPYYSTCSVGWCDPCYSPWYSCCRPARRTCSPCGWYGGCCGWSSCYTSCCGGTVSVAAGCCGSVSVPAAVPAPAITPAPVTPSLAPTPAIKTPAPSPLDTMPAPTDPTPPAATSPALPKEPGASLGPTLNESGSITVWAPADAKVTINGLATRATGSKRQFVSFGLQPGLSYRYEIRAEITREGQVVSDTRTITLTAGQRGAVAFGFNGANTENVAAN
jgi:uncharacterized protein (TIGR03000 family)